VRVIIFLFFELILLKFHTLLLLLNISKLIILKVETFCSCFAPRLVFRYSRWGTEKG